MATVIGLNRKYVTDAEAAIKQVFNDANSAEFKALAKIVDDTGNSKAVYSKIEEAGAARYRLIKRFQSQPPSKELLASVQEKLQELNVKQVEALRRLHVKQLEEMEEEIDRRGGTSEADKHRILEGLKKAQKKQIEDMQAIAEEDQKNLTDFDKKYNARMSAAMIMRHLGKDHDKDAAEKAKDAAGQLTGTNAGKPDLVQRFGIWNTVSDWAFGSSETLRGWVSESKEGYEYEKWGGVEYRFARSHSMSDLVYENGRWEYKEPDKKKRAEDEQLFMGVEQMGRGGRPLPKKEEEDVWAINLQDDYFKSTSTHEYTDLGSAGALAPTSMALKVFNAIFGGFPGGKFSIRYDYIPPDVDQDLPGGFGLMMDLAGGAILSHSENMVRVGVLAHEAMARGWEGAELRRMPPTLKDEAYLAFRRAGFAHEDLTYYGHLFSDELKRRGDHQRGIIEKAWDDKASINDIAALALNVPNPQIASPAEFFAQGRAQDILAQFNDPLTSRSQRAELLDDAASYAFDRDFSLQFRGNLTEVQQKDAAAFLGELGILDKARALEIYAEFSRNPVGHQPNSDIQFNVFKHLGALGANDGIRPFLASVMMYESQFLNQGNPLVTQNHIDARRAALFAAIGSDNPQKLKNKAYLLLDETLSPTVAAKLYLSVPEGEERTALLNELVDVTKTYDANKLARLLVGIYKNLPQGQPDSKAMMDLFDQISDRIPFLERGPRLEALKKAFINHPELTFDERKKFLNGLKDTLDPLEVVNASYREFMSLMTVENAFFYLKDKYGPDFKDKFTKEFPFFGEAVDSDRVIKFAEMYHRTFGTNPNLAQGQDPFTSGVLQDPARVFDDAWVVQHIDTATPDYDGVAHVAAAYASETQVQPDQAQLIRAQLNNIVQIQDPVHAAKILRHLSEAVLDGVVNQANQTSAIIYALLAIQQNAIARLDPNMADRQRDIQVAELLTAEAADTQKVARSILRLPPDRQAAVLGSLAATANDEPKQKSFYKLLKALGPRTVAQAIVRHHDAGNATIFNLLHALSQVPATADNPNPLLSDDSDNVEFLAKALTACYVYRQNGQPDQVLVDISTIQFPQALRVKVLEHTNHSVVVQALMAGAIVGLNDQPAEIAMCKDIVQAMEKDADKAKAFGGIPEGRQQAVLAALPDNVKTVVFRSAHPNIQGPYLRVLTGQDNALGAMTSRSANEVLRLVSPSRSGDGNLFTTNVLDDNQRRSLLSKATVLRSEFLRSLWSNNFNTLSAIMNLDRFNGVPEAQNQRANAIDDYLQKIARAGLMLVGVDPAVDRAKAFFVTELVRDINPIPASVHSVRAQMLMQLVDGGDKAKAKDYFDALGDQKAALQAYMGNKYNTAEFNVLRGVVGLARIAPPEQNQGPRQR